ncbi:hypothetical protein GQ457_13G024100 [Hibiscus cannabinus]
MGGRRLRKKGSPSPLYGIKRHVKLFRIALDGAKKLKLNQLSLPEPSTKPPVGPEIEIETEPPAVEPKYVVETEPVEPEPSIETEPLVESDESNEFEDSDYNGYVRSEYVTSEFDDSDFSVEDMSQFHVDAGIYFEGNVRVPPSVGKERVDSESETEVSVSLHSPNESDSDSGKKKKQRFTEFNSATDLDNPELKVGMVFSDRDVLKDAIKNYSLQIMYTIRLKFNDKRRVKAVCKPGCPWVVWGARLNPHDPLDNTWQIKTMNSQNSCSKEYKNLNLSSKIIAKKIYDYLSELRLTNPGTTTVCQLDDRVFQRTYICLKACKDGFKSCRPIIFLDGCHLKGYHQGHLLAGVAIDANDCIYPIIFAVVDSEIHSSWCWFLKILAEDLELTNSHYLSFMTDKQKGMVEGLPEVFSHSKHRTCVGNLYMNFKLKFTGKALKDALWKAVRATYLREFEVALIEMKALSPKSHEWLVGKDPKIGPNHIFLVTVNVICWLIICVSLLTRIAKKKVEADKWSTILCPKIQKKLDAAIESSNRPQKNRKKDADEKNDHIRKVGKKGLRMNCSKCGQSGHNVRTCKGVIGGNSQLNRISSVHPQTQPSRGRAVPKLPVKRPFGGIRIRDATTSIPSEQVPHHHRPSTQLPPITLVKMMMNSGNNSMSQPTTATSNFPTNDQ